MKCNRFIYPIEQINFIPIESNFLFLDIETTGFSRESSALTVIGLLWSKEDHLVLEQWMKEKDNCCAVSEEKALLLKLEELLASFSSPPVLIHYNGTTFDLPYLKAKCDKYGISNLLCQCPSIDLYHLAKKYRHFFYAAGLKQKNMEEAFGLFREDTLSGTELIACYQKGIETNDSNLLDLYLLHNKEDMEGMLFLYNLLHFDRLFHGHFKVQTWQEITDSSYLLVTLKGDFCIKTSLLHHIEGIYVRVDKDHLSLRIPFKKMEAKYFYPNYKDYYYLPMEDQAVHKSIAFYVEKEFRQKASKENCYVKKAGTFCPLPLPSKKKERKEILSACSDLTLFYEHYDADTAYLLVSDLNTQKSREQYLSALLLFVLFSQK